jgi:site-specific recombinase XerD
MFFIYLADSIKRPVTAVQLSHITKKHVLDFLEYLETERGNSVSTRNYRLSCIRSFVNHLIRRDATRAGQYQQVLSLRQKKQRLFVTCYVEPEEMQVILRQPDRRTRSGLRDYALMLFLYNTGARISEGLGVRRDDLQLVRPYHVQLHGKGRRERVTPIWPMTAKTMKQLVIRWEISPNEQTFRNLRGEPLGRDGAAYILNKHVKSAAATAESLKRKNVTPHVLRHGCAVALLQAGVDLAVIRDYLGHESVATTGRYTRTNLHTKRKVLETFWDEAGLSRPRAARWTPNDELLAFLSSL